MSEELICPDCGGFIGATPGEGRQVCICFQERLTPAFTPTVTTEEIAEPVVQKLCRVCGKDLAGHRRLKDSTGYICLDCDNKERGVYSEANDGLVSCAECGKRLKPAGLVNYSGTMICRTCFNDHKEMSKFQAPPPNLSVFDDRAKRSLKTMLIVGGVLGVIVLLAFFHVIGR